MAISHDRPASGQARGPGTPRARRGIARAVLDALAVYLAFALLGTMMLVETLWSSVLLRLYPPAQRPSIMRRRTSRMFDRFLRAMQACGFLELDLGELDALRDEVPLIIAPNHPSLIDAALMISRLPRSVCIMKSSLDGNAFLGAGARMCGYIRNDSAHAMVRGSIAALRDGNQLLIFPEGSRTSRAPIDPLTGAFALVARRAAVPVQMVIIEADSAFLGKGWPLSRRPNFPLRYRARLGERFEPAGSADDILARVTAGFERELGAPPQA